MMNIKMEINSQLSVIESEKQTKQTSRTETESWRYGDHLEGYQLGGVRGRMGEKLQVIRSISGWYKIDRGGLTIVWEM